MRHPIRCRIAVALLLTGCAGEPTRPAASAPSQLTELPRQLTVAEQKVLGAGNDFTFALLGQLARAQPGKNVFASPLSASMALGMTLNGAAGRTFDEMRAALQVQALSREEINHGYRSLIDLLRGLDPATDIRIANSIWYERSLPVEASFLDATRAGFDARAEALDFGSPTALTTINGWVAASTNGKIPTILETIDPDLVMALINAIYFKGTWRDRFDPSQTMTAPFHGADGIDRPVKLMHRSGVMPYAETARYQAVELPYGNGAFAVTVLLPKAGTSADELAAQLTAEDRRLLTGALSTNQVDLHLPRFTLTWERRLDDDLRALGMVDAFDRGRADFSRISRETGLYVGFVLQKTFVEVDEEGTEAAAVTAVGVRTTSAAQPATMRADRPFVFMLRERLSGTVLFAGKIASLP